MKYCNKCGYSLNSEDKFCARCGSRIEIKVQEKIVESQKVVQDENLYQSESYSSQSTNVNYRELNFDKKENYNSVHSIGEVVPRKSSLGTILSVLRYLFGITMILVGVLELTFIFILGGISLLPITYKYVESFFNLNGTGKTIVRITSIILPILLLLTPMQEGKPKEVQIVNSKNSISIGEVLQVSAKTNVEGYDKSNFSWESSNPKVATISNGYLSGVSEGTTVISVVTENGIKAEFTLIVKYIPMTSLKITGDDTFFTGSQKKMSVSLSPSNATNKKLTWSSSNPAVATVDQSGNVNAVAKGNTVIKVVSTDGVTSEHSLSVFQSVESLSLSKSDFNLKVGASTSLTYTISPKSASDSPIEWRSSNQSVATVVNGKVTGVAPGKSTITLTVGNKTISASVMVQKKAPISIVNFSYTKNTVGGVEWTFRLRNNTDKTINYITLVWYNFNAVGDPVYDEITDKNYHGVKFTGPLNAGATTTSRRTTNLFYSFSYKSSVISDVKIEYADGTTETIKNEDLILLYDFSVPK